ncbi:MAG: trypsin-like peptidase domain-containing protein [Eubacterium sp.]|nr:trypsin-like peptidase domain-containing protein [Eubacterium sp.]
MENEEKYVVGYDTQTGEPIYNDGSRGVRPMNDRTLYDAAESVARETADSYADEKAPNYRINPEPAQNRWSEHEGTTQNQNRWADPIEPQPMPEGNVYRFQNTEAVRPKKKKASKGWTMPKIALGAVMFGVIASACFFGVNMGLKALTGENEKQEQTIEEASQPKIEATTDNSQVNSVSTGDVSAVVEQVMPSVVSIKETQTTENMFGQKYQAQGAGSGFIVKQDGDELLVITNSHVVAGAEKIDVVFCDDEEVEATVKGTSSSYDIALLTVDMNKLKDSTKSKIKAATLRSSDDLKIGEMAIAIGNSNAAGQSVTVGYVSAKNRTFWIGTTNAKGEANTLPMIQTDAEINPGNSGGPLIDVKGRVIGITTSKEFTSSDGRDVDGMSYAIPMSDAVSVINDLMNREVLKDEEKGYLGITGQAVDQEASEQYNIPTGVYVTALSDTGAAAKAGIQQGDVITAIDGTEVAQVTDIQEIVNSKRVGTTIEVTLQRNNGKSYDEKKVSVTLKSKDTLDGLPQDAPADNEQDGGDSGDDEGIPDGYDYDDGYQVIPWGFGD